MEPRGVRRSCPAAPRALRAPRPPRPPPAPSDELRRLRGRAGGVRQDPRHAALHALLHAVLALHRDGARLLPGGALRLPHRVGGGGRRRGRGRGRRRGRPGRSRPRPRARRRRPLPHAGPGGGRGGPGRGGGGRAGRRGAGVRAALGPGARAARLHAPARRGDGAPLARVLRLHGAAPHRALLQRRPRARRGHPERGARRRDGAERGAHGALDVRGGVGPRGEAAHPRDRGGGGARQLHQAHGYPVDDGPEASEDELGEGVPHHRPVPHPGLQAAVQLQGGRHQAHPLLQRDERLARLRHPPHRHPLRGAGVADEHAAQLRAGAARAAGAAQLGEADAAAAGGLPGRRRHRARPAPQAPRGHPRRDLTRGMRRAGRRRRLRRPHRRLRRRPAVSAARFARPGHGRAPGWRRACSRWWII